MQLKLKDNYECERTLKERETMKEKTKWKIANVIINLNEKEANEIEKTNGQMLEMGQNMKKSSTSFMLSNEKVIFETLSCRF